jgi:hypothetical protein
VAAALRPVVVQRELQEAGDDGDLVDLRGVPIPRLDHAWIGGRHIRLAEAREVLVVGALDLHQAAPVVRQES